MKVCLRDGLERGTLVGIPDFVVLIGSVSLSRQSLHILRKPAGPHSWYHGQNTNSQNDQEVCCIIFEASWICRDIRLVPLANQFYDTTKDTVLKITYQPPDLKKPSPADENAYINALFSPRPRPFDESTPMEYHVTKELSNPHSRAKKQARWQAAKVRRVELLKKFVERELVHLNGRPTRVARAEGVFKFRQKMEEDRKAEKKRRWLTAERLSKIERKVKRKQRKAQKQKEKLTQLVLKDAANQVIPAAKPRT